MLTFAESPNPFFKAFAAKAAPWQFLMLHDPALGWTVSHRLINPKEPVSASSTMQGPFETREDAEQAANDKLIELRRMA